MKRCEIWILALTVLLSGRDLLTAKEGFEYRIRVACDTPVNLSDVAIAPMIDVAEGVHSVAVCVEDEKGMQSALALGTSLHRAGLKGTFYFLYIDGMVPVVEKLSAMGHEIALRSASNCDQRGVSSALPFIPLARVQNELIAHQRVLQRHSQTPVQTMVVMCEGAGGFLPSRLTRQSGFLTYFLAEPHGLTFLSEDWDGPTAATCHNRSGATGGPGPGEANWQYKLTQGRFQHGGRIHHSVSGMIRSAKGDGTGTEYPVASDGLLRLPVHQVHDYIYMKEHTVVKTVKALEDGKAEILMAVAPGTNFRFARAPMTVMIKRPGATVSAATAGEIPCTFKNRPWGATVTVPPSALMGGPLEVRFAEEVSMTAPEKKGVQLLVRNGSDRQVDKIVITPRGSRDGLSAVRPGETFSLKPGQTKTVPLTLETKIVDFDRYAYGLKSLHLAVEFEQSGVASKVMKDLDVYVVPMLAVEAHPWEAVVADPGGTNYFQVTLNRRTVTDGVGTFRGRCEYPTFVVPAEGRTVGHVKVETVGPFKPLTKRIEFAFERDAAASLSFAVVNTDDQDDSPGEIHLRFFIDGVGEVSPIHPPIPIRVDKRLSIEPLNDQGLVLFFDYEHDDGEKIVPTAASNPKIHLHTEPHYGGSRRPEYVDGVFGKAVKNGTGQWIYHRGELNANAGTIVFWMRRTFEENRWQHIFNYHGGHMISGAAGRWDDGQAWGMCFETDGTIRTYMTMAGGRPKTLRFPAPAMDGKFHHVALVWNIPKRILRVHIDGRVAAQASPADETVPWLPSPAFNPNTVNGLMFSKYNVGTDKDQAAFFCRDLSEEEILRIMKEGVIVDPSRKPSSR